MTPLDLQDRYSRQELFEPIGEQGQRRIRSGSAVLVGCGALGSTIANSLVRAGIGSLIIIDSDRLEWSNLQRQTLFDEAQVRQKMYKAQAAQERLLQINSEVAVHAVTQRLTADNPAALLGRPTLVLDGTDNFAARYLINDWCVQEGIPWIYGGCAASYGMAMPVIPGRTPCLRCLFPDPPGPGQSPTCNQIGIIAPIAHTVASIEVAEALKILSGNIEIVQPRLITVDLWALHFEVVRLAGPDAACPCCGERRFEFLDKRRAEPSTLNN